MGRFFGAIAAVALSCGLGVAASPPAQAASICDADRCLAELQLGATDLDVTRSATTVAVRAHLSGPAGFGDVQIARFTGAATTLAGRPQEETTAVVTLRRTSGSATDGWWSGSFTPTTGWATTYDVGADFLPRSPDGPVLAVGPARLAAAGQPYRITTRVTAGPPATPTGLSATTAPWFNLYDGRIETVVDVAWSGPRSGAIVAGGYEYRASGSCGQPTALLVVGATRTRLGRTNPAGGPWCTVQIRALNHVGASAWTNTVRAYLP